MKKKFKIKLLQWIVPGLLWFPEPMQASFEPEYDRCFQYFARLKFDYTDINSSDDFDRHYGIKADKRRLFVRFCYEIINREPEYKTLLGRMTWTKTERNFNYGRGRNIRLVQWMLEHIHPHESLDKKIQKAEDEIISSPKCQPPEMLDQLIGPIVR